jgi:hypothetical protein
MNLRKIMDDFAETLSKKACEKNTPLQESTDAFKALTAYYAVLQKQAKKGGDDDTETDGFTFGEDVVHGRAKTTATRRNS